MSQNNTIRKSDKKFIRLEKARIRRQFLDIKKQEELIDNLYKKFIKQPEGKPEVESKKDLPAQSGEPKKVEVKQEAKKSEAKPVAAKKPTKKAKTK